MPDRRPKPPTLQDKSIGIERYAGSAADQYHLASSNTRVSKLYPKQFQVSHEPRILEMVQDSPHHIDSKDRVRLDVTEEKLTMSLDEVVLDRAYRREYDGAPIPLRQLAKLLYYGNGIRKLDADERGGYIHKRNVPSAGNLGSTDLYCFALNVEGLKAGLYHFDALQHELALLKAGNFADWMNEFCFYQIEVAEAAAVIVLVGTVERIAQKYGQRAYRLALLDAGHAAQNMFLAATAMKLAAWPTGGFIDDELNRALGLDGLESCALLTLCIGKRVE